jgi:hypothetical protein
LAQPEGIRVRELQMDLAYTLIKGGHRGPKLLFGPSNEVLGV